jgi:hypothetical protein
MARRPDWPAWPAALLSAVETRAFDAHRWNCVRFALAAVEAVTGAQPRIRILPDLAATADSAGFPRVASLRARMAMSSSRLIPTASAWCSTPVASLSSDRTARCARRSPFAPPPGGSADMPAAVPLIAVVAGGVGAGVAFAQIGIIGFDGQIDLEAPRLYGLPEDAPAILYGCPSLPAGTRTLALETSWDLPSLAPGATANLDLAVPGARQGDFADASLGTSRIAFVLDCHVWSNNSLRVTARNISASTVDLAAAPLAVQVVKRRLA